MTAVQRDSHMAVEMDVTKVVWKVASLVFVMVV